LATRKNRKRKAPPVNPGEIERLQRVARELDTVSADATAVGQDVGRDVADELFIQHRMVRSPKFDS
jgi:hypothetical protein